ncbi:MAG: hypothetical protein ACO1RX_09460 [Candidatus Sericytochromatia bacterium]
MKKQQYQWALISLGLAVSVGCTVPFLVNTRDNTGASGGQVITDPNAVSSSLPIFLPVPGSTNPPLVLPSAGGPFQPVASGNPPITGPLPNPTATPFLPNLPPNIDNQIGFNPLPVLGGGTGSGSGGSIITQPIVKSVIRGRVLGFNPFTAGYEPISNAQVRIDETLALTTNASGYYETTQEFDKVVSISAASNGYIGSSVTDVPPGINRDIHLNPLNERIPYRQDVFTVSGTVTNLAQNGRRPVVVFSDGNDSVAGASIPDSGTGRYSMDVRLRSNRSTTNGSLFAAVMEDSGKLQAVTQYGYSPSVQVPVPPPQPVPTATPDDSGDDNFVPLKATDLLLSFNHLVSPEAFGQITVNFTPDSGANLQGAVLHVYMNLPAPNGASNGGRVLVAKYNDATSTTISQTIRVPRVPGASFTVVAHSGTAQRGSDIVVPNLQVGSTITRTFLPVPAFSQVGDETEFSDPNKTHFLSADLTPQISWASMSGINSYQLDLQAELPETFRWEAYTLGTGLTYPDFGADHPLSLKEGRHYRLQLMASDFDIGTFNILSQNAAQDWKTPSRFEKAVAQQPDGGFGIQLLNPAIRNFSQGYRISYSTVSFVTE